VWLFNDYQEEGEAEIERCNAGKALLLIRTSEKANRESPFCVRLFQGAPKGDRMAWVIQKATELGAREIGVFIGERSVPRWEPDRVENRMVRWRAILLEAARQSGRTRKPELSGPWSLETLCERALESDVDLKLLFWEGEEALGLGGALQRTTGDCREAWLVVGPEGGFEQHEVERLRKAGFRSVRIGPRVLRTETAGPSAMAILQYLYGDLG
jgi:16S rRNA (uracil1498-N3)-methyltransferase